jgi:hypothetical protein
MLLAKKKPHKLSSLNQEKAAHTGRLFYCADSLRNETGLQMLVLHHKGFYYEKNIYFYHRPSQPKHALSLRL